MEAAQRTVYNNRGPRAGPGWGPPFRPIPVFLVFRDFLFSRVFGAISGFLRFSVISADFHVFYGNPAFLVAGAEKHDIPKHLLTFSRCHFRRDPHFRGNRGFP